jgi:hypothetical protein
MGLNSPAGTGAPPLRQGAQFWRVMWSNGSLGQKFRAKHSKRTNDKKLWRTVKYNRSTKIPTATKNRYNSLSI